ncbi:16S rRNA m(7)G-527 methyltransferase [Motilibacter rhizosphaerae]|uniref:Ribosomal RNA small subunit methyltransferase G n=1 Tax=Motilibacter rhizosphaerae TaxID=598652 RepID=A0A4Q7NVQ3_9ACTN|nr:16S rRNA (guanine(527)-N(7))-methyltransferase RsmG [Motilibacter rhizosphaerae]RZS91224.1 16S rRNA m(7)G-527 methyltransferase [Motilibacter rhizosphaerae]
MFGERYPLAERYVAWLDGAGVERGLIGPRERERLWDRHVLNCANLAELLVDGERVLDVGSGAGLPGIPVALALPTVQVVLLEPLLRRATFLEEVVADLGLGDRVQVLRARAEEAKVQGDVVTSRAVAPLGKLAGWCGPLLRDEGRMLAVKGASAAEELRSSAKGLRHLGFTSWQVVTCGEPESPTTVIEARYGTRRKR